MRRVYLAGPIFQCEDHECIHWREEAKRALEGFTVIDPMERDYRGKTDENFREIVEQDKALIDACEIVLVNHLKPSVGTSMEILYAWENQKQIFIVTENGHNSPWLLYHSHGLFASLKAAITHIREC